MGTWQSDQANNAWDLKIKEGGTLLKTVPAYNDTASQRKYFCASHKLTGVTAAAHTYTATGTRTIGAGTHTAYAGSTIRVEIFAE